MFDFVVAKSLLHHLADEEAHDLLVTARRVLREGGVFSPQILHATTVNPS
jgi:cyclopropane fatty-acyl-phospholipid synthase-like methyltransferase